MLFIFLLIENIFCEDALDIYLEACGLFYDIKDEPVEQRRCSKTERFCCGKCNDRYCCNTTSDRLNQLECKIVTKPTEPSNTNS